MLNTSTNISSWSREEDLAAKEAELLQLTGNVMRHASSARSTPGAPNATPSVRATPDAQVCRSSYSTLCLALTPRTALSQTLQH